MRWAAGALVFGLWPFRWRSAPHRGGRSIALVGSLAILVTYYLVMTSLEGAALNTPIPSAVAIVAPTCCSTIVGLGLLVRPRASGGGRACRRVRGLEALRRACRAARCGAAARAGEARTRRTSSTATSCGR